MSAPRPPSVPEPTPGGESAAADAASWPLADRVLLVDDCEEDVVLFRRLLKRAQIDVALDIAMDGEMAIRWLSEKIGEAGCGRPVLPRAIFLDLKLPGISGSEVLRWIRGHRLFEKTLVVICSSMAADEDVMEVERLGAHVYLAKFPPPERIAALFAITDPRSVPPALRGFSTGR